MFNIGVTLTILVVMFQGSKSPDGPKISYELFRNLLFLGWWIVPICGVSAGMVLFIITLLFIYFHTVVAFIGVLYPAIDIANGRILHMLSYDFASSLKCVVLFLGLNHLCAVSTLKNMIKVIR